MMNAFRNLYKIWWSGKLVAILTAANDLAAVDAYYTAGGGCSNVEVERMTHGFDGEVNLIYA